MGGVSSLARDLWELAKLKTNPYKAFTADKQSLEVQSKLQSLGHDNSGLKFTNLYLEIERNLGVSGQKWMSAPSMINLKKRLKRSESLTSVQFDSVAGFQFAEFVSCFPKIFHHFIWVLLLRS